MYEVELIFITTITCFTYSEVLRRSIAAYIGMTPTVEVTLLGCDVRHILDSDTINNSKRS